ncbi:hypothetical protein E2C01_094444 [Portunus trituberculatus]|uniref:Uncharacterized protein n=1 Tax=Portunus trituberculatus TaxID=210409 RepID=A0A5B7JQF8_PORTR|nr:hypothetical protein [Portunus trituberculatus]
MDRGSNLESQFYLGYKDCKNLDKQSTTPGQHGGVTTHSPQRFASRRALLLAKYRLVVSKLGEARKCQADTAEVVVHWSARHTSVGTQLMHAGEELDGWWGHSKGSLG